MNRSWAISLLSLVCVVACAPAEEGEDVLGGQRAASGGVRSNTASGGSKSSSSSGGERANASGGASGGLGSGGAAALAASGGVAGGFSAASASGGMGAGGAILLTTGGAGNGPTLVFGNGNGGVFATGGVRNSAGAPQAGSTAFDPNSDTHIDLNGDASTEFEPSSGDLGGGGVRTTLDWGP